MSLPSLLTCRLNKALFIFLAPLLKPLEDFILSAKAEETFFKSCFFRSCARWAL